MESRSLVAYLQRLRIPVTKRHFLRGIFVESFLRSLKLLLQQQISKEQITKYCGREIQFNNVIIVLGLSVIPEHEEVFENTYALLKPGGNYVIIDVYADKFVPTSWWTKLLARADLKRKSWELLEKKTSGFSLNNISKNRHLHGGLLYIASGKKKSG